MMNYSRMNIFKNRRGSALVFLAILFSSLASMMALFIHISEKNAIDSAVQSLGRIWGNSILAEYDLNLYERYHLLAYYGEIRETEEKLNFYVRESLGHKAKIKYEGVYFDPFDYALTDIDILKEQIKKACLSSAVSEPIGICPDEKPYKPASDRKIMNRSIIKALPSYGRDDINFIDRIKKLAKSLGSLDNLIKEGTDTYSLIKYIEANFYNARRLNEDDRSFFRYEEEYIICGKDSDASNLNGVKTRIIAIREVLNLLYIESDPDMQAKILALAELTGPVTPAAQQAIGAAWALAESINDYRLLINGEKIPLRKDKKSWATDIDAISSGMEEGYVNPGSNRGNTYEDYLLFFINMINQEIKYMRIMDLIQINMKYCYYSDFLLEDYFAGLTYEVNVNKKAYKFENGY